MPGIESDSKSAAASIITSNTTEHTTEDNANDLLEEEPKPIRELTQTDRINKSLLTSFLERMNTEGFPNQNVDAERNENKAKEEDFAE